MLANRIRLFKDKDKHKIEVPLGAIPRYFNPHSPSKSLILLSGSQYFRYKSWC